MELTENNGWLLLIDRDLATRRLLADLLEQAGYRVRVAGTLADVGELDDQPALAIADIAAGSAVRSQWRLVPLVLTGFYDAADAEEAARIGATYLLKPIVPDFLLAAVARHVASARGLATMRRWTRRRVAGHTPIQIDDVSGRIHDVSYGGLRLELVQAADPLSHVFEVVLVPLNVSLLVRIAWASRDGPTWICGAEIVNVKQSTLGGWRDVVDAISE